MFVVEEILDTLEGITTDFLNKIFKFLSISRRKLPWMGVDGSDEGSCGLSEEDTKVLKMLMHLRNRVYHFL
jgi:hypothetical protein